MDKDDTFVIVVMDLNDNSPVFPPDLSGSISESSIAGKQRKFFFFFHGGQMCGQTDSPRKTDDVIQLELEIMDL